MQLNLLTRLGARVVMSRAEPPSTVPGSWRDSAISQLDALARANERAAARARRRRRLWTAGLSGVVLLWGVAMWRQAIDPPRVPAPLLAHVSTRAAPLEPAAAAVVAEVSLVSTAPTLLAAASVAALAADSATTPSSSVVTDAVPVAASADDEAARKARAQGLARRKAAQQAQERDRAEDEAQQRQRLALAAQMDAERALQQQLADADAAARERAAAAERERRQALLLAQHSPRGVAELCGGGGWAAEQQCQARQCYRAEHQGDAVCQRLRDQALARLQRGADH
jgi:hypothetical protein